MCDLLVWVSSPQRELGGRAPGTHFRVEGVQYCLIWPSSKILLLCRICHVGKVNFCVDYDNCQEGEFCLVPSACLCLSQVGHLLLPWPQMGPVCGLSIIILILSPNIIVILRWAFLKVTCFQTLFKYSSLISSWLNSRYHHHEARIFSICIGLCELMTDFYHTNSKCVHISIMKHNFSWNRWWQSSIWLSSVPFHQLVSFEASTMSTGTILSKTE